MNMNAQRAGGFASFWAARPFGVMDSSQGSAKAAPAPRNIVLREIGWFIRSVGQTSSNNGNSGQRSDTERPALIPYSIKLGKGESSGKIDSPKHNGTNGARIPAFYL
jgi:hypothetical protein